MKRLFAIMLLIFLSSYSFSQQGIKAGEDIAVTSTESGQVRGYIRNGIFTYKGIPYGEAERFETARKPGPWEGVRSSMTYGPVAPLLQPTTAVNDEVEFVFDHNWGYANENCLVLNVWTPSISDGKKRPVMFWMHGGGFTAGSSQELPSYDGENLSKTGDVVVVSVNHRLNILGFLDMSAYGDKYRHSANQGMLDLVLALEWVKENIENFGGDPGNVTIFGQSGGGAKVATLMAMPSAKGLFHKAVNQSGAFRTGSLAADITRSVTAEILKELDLDASEADALQTIPFDQLSAAGTKAIQTVSTRLREEGRPVPGFGLNWGPSVDGDVIPHDTYSNETLELSKDIPLLIGTVKNEFMASLQAGLANGTEEEVMNYIQNRFGDNADAFIAAVRKAYPEDTRPSDLIDVDVLFRPGAVEMANIKSEVAGGAPVYMYLFTWQSPVFDGKYKALHCMELPFVFNNIARCESMTGGGPEAYALAEKVSAAWVNFARSGNPSHPGLPEWPAYNTQNTATMHFNNTCEVKPQMDKELFQITNSR